MKDEYIEEQKKLREQEVKEEKIIKKDDNERVCDKRRAV